MRLIIAAALVLPTGLLIVSTGGWLLSAVQAFCNLIGMGDVLSESSRVGENYWLYFTYAAGMFSVYILAYTILRFGIKLKTHYIDMTLILVTISAIMAPILDGPKGEMFENFDFFLAMIFLFDTIIFGLFAASSALLDKFTAFTTLKDWQKFIIALAASLPVGLLVSWLVWVPIARNYLR
jgi:membrane-associated HD superfamily phosphohydrolase